MGEVTTAGGEVDGRIEDMLSFRIDLNITLNNGLNKLTSMK